MEETLNKQKKMDQLASRLWKLARDTIIVNLRFMDVALLRIVPVPRAHINGIVTDGSYIYYDSEYVLREYKKDAGYVTRVYLHVLLHSIFYHNFQFDKMYPDYWNLATDIAVENIILEMGLESLRLENDFLLEDRLRALSKNIPVLTAEKIYRYFLTNSVSESGYAEMTKLFGRDEHMWQKVENLEVSQADWQKISERIKADLKSFSKDKNKSRALEENLKEATRERYNYRDILTRFTVLGEDMTINDDEFDYIYYTYGLDTYGNMPLVEPLEYKEVHKIRDFAIVLDTSASCNGHLVHSFLKKTYSILMETESFFKKINLHIIMCDNEVHSDVKITCQKDLDDFVKNGKLYGFGGTDFRPAFRYVDQMIENKEFDHFKGLIYFTDGYGIYPEKMPGYDAMFVFLDEDEHRLNVPPWAIRVVLSKEDIEDEYQAG